MDRDPRRLIGVEFQNSNGEFDHTADSQAKRAGTRQADLNTKRTKDTKDSEIIIFQFLTSSLHDLRGEMSVSILVVA
jgi:hypothetical protein